MKIVPKSGWLGVPSRKNQSENVTCYLSSSCHVAHKASTQSHKPSLSAAAIFTSLQFFHLAFSISLFAVLLHVVLGLPCFHRPSGVQVNAVLQSLFSSFQYICFGRHRFCFHHIYGSSTSRSHTSRLALLVSYIA